MAKKGHINSMLLLGYLYLDYVVNKQEARYWLKAEALKRNSSAMFQFAVLLHYDEEGYEWLKKLQSLVMKRPSQI